MIVTGSPAVAMACAALCRTAPKLIANATPNVNIRMFICIECHKASGCAQVWRRDRQRAGQWIGLDKEEVIRIFGHSARVGAAQDLLR
jgi:hypothetical protein